MSTKRRATAFILALLMIITAIVPNIALATENDVVGDITRYSVTLNKSDNGTIKFDSEENDTEEFEDSTEPVDRLDFAKGDTVSLIIFPNDGYEGKTYELIDSATKETIDSGTIEDDSISFEMPDNDVVVDVGFAKIEQSDNVDEDAIENTPSDDKEVENNSEQNSISSTDEDIDSENSEESDPADGNSDSEESEGAIDEATTETDVLLGTASELESMDEETEEKVEDLIEALEVMEVTESGSIEMPALYASRAATESAKLVKTSSPIVHWSRWFNYTWKCNAGETHTEKARQFSRHMLDGEYAYCIQPYADSSNGDTYTGTTHDKEDYNGKAWMKELTSNERKYIERVVAFGYPNYDYDVDKCAAYVATQALVWETAMGMRGKGFTYTGSTAGGAKDLYHCIYSTVDAVNWGSDTKTQFKKDFKKAYDAIEANVQAAIDWSNDGKYFLSYLYKTAAEAKSHAIKFTDETFERDIVDSTTGKVRAHAKSYHKGSYYYIELTDPNDKDNTTSEYYYWKNSYVTVTTSKNKVTIKCPDSKISHYTTKRVLTYRTDLVDLNDYEFMVWEKSSKQTLFTYADGEPVTGYIYLKYSEAEDEKPGYLRIKKVSESNANEVIANATYYLYTDSACKNRATDTNGKKVSFKTNSSGYTASVELDPGTYYLKEYDAPDGYFASATVTTCKITEATTVSKTVTEVKGTPTSIVKVNAVQTSTKIPEAMYGMFKTSAAASAASKLAAANDLDNLDESTLVPTTDGGGAIFITTDTGSNTVYVQPGTYYIAELEVPDGYQLNRNVVTVTVKANTNNVFTMSDYPNTGAGNIVKTSTANANTKVSGAKYTLYKTQAAAQNKDASQIAKDVNNMNAVLTTNGTSSNTLTLYPGTYYVRETTAAAGYLIDNTVYPMVIKSGETTTLNVKDTPVTPCYVIKRDSTNNSKIVAGAQYTLYTTQAGATARNSSLMAKDVYGNNAVLTTTATNSNTLQMTPDTYYAIETVAPSGYTRSNTVYTVTLPTGQTTPVVINATDAPKSYINLKKASGNTTLTNGNSCYSLTGAVYYVYSDSACTNKVGQLTTTADGSTNTISVDAGTYYVKEITPSKGYGLCDGSQTDGANTKGVHTVTVAAGKTGTVSCKEPPLNDPFSVQMQKLDADTGKPTAQGTASLKGAIFEVDYYTNTDGTASGTPFKKWYFKTDANGKLSCRLSSYLVNNNSFKSDALYTDPIRGIIYPLGTYTIKEVQAPEKYQLDGTMSIDGANGTTGVTDGISIVIKADANGEAKEYYKNLETKAYIQVGNYLQLNVADEIYKGSVSITKLTTDGQSPLAGVSFKLVGDDGSTYTGKTDSNGKLVFEELIPQHYVLTEVSTVDGQDLLADNIDLNIPLEMTEVEAKAKNADMSKAVWDPNTSTWCFYDLNYTIDNSPTFVLPMTGGSDLPWFTIAGLMLLGVGTVAIIWRRRKSTT